MCKSACLPLGGTHIPIGLLLQDAFAELCSEFLFFTAQAQRSLANIVRLCLYGAYETL